MNMVKSEPKKCGSEKPLKAPEGCALDLAGLVDYAEGAIVSRTLVDNEAGSVTLFAFDAGQALSEHSAPFDALAHVLDGQAALTVGGKSIRARAGELVVIPANVPHAVESETRFKMVLTMLRSSR
ncbi:MAG: cupin domain-containing protein [Planctomycetota bacterium]|jgi:quercetin dioxygenase-like cupin family protein